MDPKDDEERHYNPFLNCSDRNNTNPNPVPRPQFRKEVSKARWDDELRMGEVVEMKGSLWTSTGIVRNGGKLYCWIEEILFLVERGALLLLNDTDTILTLKDIHKKIDEGRNGCSWDLYIAYRRLKSLGYILGRHGVFWTSKGERSYADSIINTSSLDASSDASTNGDGSPLMRWFSDMQINDVRPAFDVYLPDSKFRKSAPGNPDFVLCMTRGTPPTRAEVEKLEQICCGIPLKFCHVDNWLVNFVAFEKIELPVLP